MCDLEIPLYGNSVVTKNTHKKIVFKCNYCNKKIKGGALIGANRTTDDFMKIDYNLELLYFCDFICGKLYDTNVNTISIDVKDYRKKFLSKSLSKDAEIIYKQVNNQLFTQLPVKKCSPITKEDFNSVKIGYRKVL